MMSDPKHFKVCQSHREVAFKAFIGPHNDGYPPHEILQHWIKTGEGNFKSLDRHAQALADLEGPLLTEIIDLKIEDIQRQIAGQHRWMVEHQRRLIERFFPESLWKRFCKRWLLPLNF